MSSCGIGPSPSASSFFVHDYFEINHSTTAATTDGTVDCSTRDENSCCPHCNQPIDAHQRIDADVQSILRCIPQERQGSILSIEDARLGTISANETTTTIKQPAGEDVSVVDVSDDDMVASAPINGKRHRDSDDEITRKKRALDEPNPLSTVTGLQDQQVMAITKYELFHSILISLSLVLL